MYGCPPIPIQANIIRKMAHLQDLQEFYPLIYLDNFSNINQFPQQTTLLENIVPFWATNQKFWFSHTPLTSWPTYQTEYIHTLEHNLSLILHYDQLYRHPNPNIKDADKPLAYRFATHIALKILHSEQFAAATEWQQVFILLTLRHNNSLLLKELCLKKLYNLINKSLSEEQTSSLFLRFLNATVWDIHTFKHQLGYNPEPSTKNHMPLSDLFSKYKNILQEPLIPSQKPAKIHEIQDKLYTVFRQAFSNHPSDTFAISISGGVDSMVAAHVAKKVTTELNKTLILLHINYNNRDTCEEECDLLRDYASIISTPLYIRKITEICRERNSNFRTLYEDVTRRIRFSFYSAFKCPVILGHNLDDCLENVFQNLSKQIHFDNLFGMKPKGEEQNVEILRPMIEISKRDILLYSDHTHIPHLYDSTPAWSRRGQMRDNLIPNITAFDPNILLGLQQFIKYSSFLDSQWQTSFKAWCDTIHQSDAKEVICPRNDFFEANYMNLNFWIKLWQNLSQSLCIKDRPSNKSFTNLITMIQTPFKKCEPSRRCNMNLKYTCIITAETITFTQYI